MSSEIIHEAREKRPLIHHLTNQVVMNFTANGLLSFGGAPIMAKAVEEAEEMASISDGVLINIGTILNQDIPAMIQAGKAANKKGIPVVVDPVGVGATSFRKEAIRQILEEINPTVIKGNAGELAHLVDIPWEIKGVDSTGEGNSEEIARKVAQEFKTIAVLTGKTDVISDGTEVRLNRKGSAMLSNVTGAGCLLGSIVTACLTTSHSSVESAFAAVEFYGRAAEYTEGLDEVKGTGTFIASFLDALSFNPNDLKGGQE
ncbi:hydroxyethylthiazole kinase [Jeotgalibacillus proteolyticus]|uniref:Hydroxyethylthiazole kinase n=1 Tax=Jeotgalibacillus proteolyticus TaxID=2082395 RepID=A0A2S5G8K9_9BACL|nr:hydroxyethylthiazole kinase [Jeotgalibacillus proteolyticus]PPA69251.1 hydroxyethylthiazole kinase [Jeotgalibacillus proteolyticus]